MKKLLSCTKKVLHVWKDVGFELRKFHTNDEQFSTSNLSRLVKYLHNSLESYWNQ